MTVPRGPALGALSVGELTEALGVSQPGVTRMLDKLETEE
jgi:DNA-binding MarR family transcriptional regulator